MKVTVHVYAMAREVVGAPSLEIEIDGNAVKDIHEALHVKYPGLQEWALKYAVNDTYVGLDHEIGVSDTVLVIPPVTGG